MQFIYGAVRTARYVVRAQVLCSEWQYGSVDALLQPAGSMGFCGLTVKSVAMVAGSTVRDMDARLRCR